MPNKATTKTTATSSNPKSSNYVPKTTTSSTSSTKTTTTPAQAAANVNKLHAQTAPPLGGPTYTTSPTSGSKTTTAPVDTRAAAAEAARAAAPAYTQAAKTTPDVTPSYSTIWSSSFSGTPSTDTTADNVAKFKDAVSQAAANRAAVTSSAVAKIVADQIKAEAAANGAAVTSGAVAKTVADQIKANAKTVADQNQADADMEAANNNAANARSSSSSGGGGSYDPNTAALQQQLNDAGASIAVDGIWGPETQAAYDAYINNIYNYGGSGGGSGWSGVGGNGGGNGEYPISQLSAVMGALLPGYINPIGSPELENLHMGDRYDLEYDYDNILNILDNATKNKYNELWNQYSQTENAYYNQNLADQSATLDNIKRAQAAATMSGASKGMQAAQMLSSILTGQQTNAGNQLELANVRNNTALSEQTELAENKNTALTTSNAVKQAIAGLDETKYGYDAQMRIGDQDYNAAIANAIGTILAQGVYAGTLDISDYQALLNSLYPQP